MILDMWVKDANRFTKMEVLRLLRGACRAAGFDVLKIVAHRFSPHGITAFALLKQSHISVHIWPEYGYVACDIFSCERDINPAVRHLMRGFSPETVQKRYVVRALKEASLDSRFFVDETEPGIQTVMAVEPLHEVDSRYQQIRVFRHRYYGKMLVIDDDIQFTERDFMMYNEALLGPLRNAGKRGDALIVGGGDGLCSTYLMKNSLARRIKIIEIDPKVPEVCLRFFPKLSWSLRKPEVDMTFGDALEVIREEPERSFRTVVVDVTAPDTEWGRAIYRRQFLLQVRRVLQPAGMLCMNGSSTWYKYGLRQEAMEASLRSVFRNVSKTVAWIPSYGSPWSFFHARKTTSSR